MPLIIAVGLQVFQQFSGINAIMFNAQTIFKESGFTNAALAMVIIGGVNVVSTILSVAVIDRWSTASVSVWFISWSVGPFWFHRCMH